MRQTRVLPAAAALLLLCLALLATATRAGTLTAKLTLSDLPTSITLCRDSNAIATFGSDEQWQIAVDIDGNLNTGESGADAVVFISTTPQTSPCTPTVVPLTSSVLVGELGVWNAGTNGFDDGGPVDVGVDTTANTLTATVDTTSGPLAGISANSRFAAAAVAAYTPMGTSTATAAYDAVAYSPPDIAVTDPTDDVMQCSSPCSTGAAYYPLIDIVGFKAGTGLPALSVDSTQFEFDVAGLPAMMTLCGYPSAFTFPGLADTFWAALIDTDSNPSTGYGGFDAVVLVYTTPQAQNCTTSTAPTTAALAGEIDTLDSQGMQTYVGPATLSVDVASGRITAAIPYDSPALGGLSLTSSVVETTQSLYAAGPTFASDQGSQFSMNSAFSDPLDDVQNCATPCGTAVSWYPQTDLVGGAAVRADRVFKAGFE